MKNKFLIIALLSTLFFSCKDYVTDIDPLISDVEDNLLNSEDQIPFLIKGVKQQFSTAMDNTGVIADGLSDQYFFDFNVPNATFPTYDDIDKGDIQFDNNSVDGAFDRIGRVRFLADDLVRRVGNISFKDETNKNKALFIGNLYGGLARYLYATYFGLEPTNGGGVIDNGPFIPSSDMYALAIDKLKAALTYTTDAAETRYVNSLIARCYLYNQQYAEAATYASNGMTAGDAPFQILYSAENTNSYWQQAGAGRSQYVVDNRFKDYITADTNEVNRIALKEKTGNDGSTIYYVQMKYPEKDSPIPLITWQENNLMLAELALRGSGSADALALVNAVRASHSIAELPSVDLDAVYVERDKELFLTGARLPDEKRFNKWHLPAGKWQYLPITQSERNNNPHIN